MGKEDKRKWWAKEPKTPKKEGSTGTFLDGIPRKPISRKLKAGGRKKDTSVVRL